MESNRSRVALTGAAGGMVYVIGQLVTGLAPAPDASTADVLEHFVDHRSGYLVGTMLATVAAGLLLVFVAHLREVMVDAEGGRSPLATATVAAWVLLFATILGGSMPLLAVTWRGAADASPEILQLAFDISGIALYAANAAFTALSLLGPILVAGHTGFLPRWLIAIGVVGIIVNVVELAGITTTSGANAAGYAAGVGPSVWLIWVVATSVVLYRRPAPS